MEKRVQALRIFVKALIFIVVLNVVFALLDPPVGKITLFNSVLPGRMRFPYEQEPAYFSIGYNAPVYEDFDAMFGAHLVSQPRRADEFRLFLIGDSATWGVGVQANETLSEQINRLDLRTCDGRLVRAYNLGYPMPFMMRDVLILDKAMEYQPDMILWLVTLYTFQAKTAETDFIAPHAERYLKLAETYDFSYPHFSHPIVPPSFWDKTILGQRKRLKEIIQAQFYGLLWAATGIDNHEGLLLSASPPNLAVDSDLHYGGLTPDQLPRLLDSLTLDVLSAGYQVAGDTPLVLVNEPIFIAGGDHGDVRYSSFYPRWAYDGYHQMIVGKMSDSNQSILDYWNTIPPEGFYDQNFHRNPIGEHRFAELLAPDILRLSCP